MLQHFGRRALLAMVMAVVVLAACSDDDPTSPDPHAEAVGAEVYDRESGELLADVHGDHWHGSIELAVGDELELDVVFLDEHGDEIPLSGDHTLGIRFADDEPDDVIAFEVHGDHADIEAEADGETAIILELVHDDHVEWETPALPVNVGS